MPTTFKHLKSHHAPWGPHMPVGLSVAPTVQAIIIDGVPVVDPQFAAIIGNNAEAVVTSPEDSHTSCPTSSKMVRSGKTRPSATCVPVVHNLTPTSHVWPSTHQVWAPTTHAKVKGVLPEETVTINGAMDTGLHSV
jgi:hypothetical protein